MATNQQMLELLVTMNNTTQAGWAQLQADMDRAEKSAVDLSGFMDHLASSIVDLTTEIRFLNDAELKNVGASAAMADGQKAVSGSLDLTSAASLRTERALLRLGGQVAGVRQGFALAGVGLTGWAAIAGGAAVFEAAKFENSMARLQANSGATTEQMKIMQAAVLDFGSKGPVSLEDVAVGMRHISDLGYRGRDSVTVMNEAFKAAVATGSKVADVANALATVLGNQHESAAMAAKDINEVTVAAQQGNLTIQDFATHYARIGVIMGSLHQPLADGAAMLATISRATGDPAVAQTYGQNMLMHIINPTKAATVVMEDLKRKTGIDLAQAFQQFAQGQISLKDVLTQSRTALQGNIGDTEKLFGGLRGGQGAVILMNNHWQDYLSVTNKVNNANQNVQAGFDRMSQTTEFKLKTLKNDAIELGIAVGKDLQPPLNHAADFLTTTLPAAIQDSDKAFHDFEKTLQSVGYDLNHLPIPKLPGTSGNSNPIGDIFGSTGITPQNIWNATPYGQALADVAKAGQIADENRKKQEAYNTAVQAWGNGIDAATYKQRAATAELNIWGNGLGKAANQQEELRKGIHATNSELEYGMSLMGQLNQAPTYKNLAGSGTVQGAPLGKDFQPSFDIQQAMKDATTHITDWASQVAKDTAKFGEHSAHVAFDNEMLGKWKLVSANLTDEWNTLIDTSTVLANANRAAAAPILAQARNLEAFGKAIQSSISTIKSYDAAGVAAAKDIRSFAAQQTRGQEVPITTSIASATIPYLTGSSGSVTSQLYANSRPYGGTPQIDPTVLDHGNYKTAEAFSPDDRAAMGKLSDTIHQLPPEFQGAFDSTVTKLQNEETKNYNNYIDKLNKENVRDADAKTKIEAAHDAAVAKANEKAQAALTKANNDYLTKLDNQEAKHNQDLENHLAAFNVAFQTALSTFEANMVADTQKAEAERQAHNDHLTEAYGTLQEQLASAHGKHAAEERQKDWDLYLKKIHLEDQGYQTQATNMENHVKGQAAAFTHHVATLKDTLDNANKNSNTTLSRQEANDKKNYNSTVSTIKGALWNAVFGPGGANATERTALSNEYATHSSRDDSITMSYHKGDKTAQQAAKDTTPTGQITTIQSGLQAAFDKAQAQVTLDIIEHGHATKADIAALGVASKGLDDFNAATNKSKNALYDLSTVAGFIGARFGNVGQSAATPPSIAATVGGGGFAATAPGVISGGLALANTFQRLVAAGEDAYKSSEVQTHANYQIAKDTGDTATAFDILDKAFLAGKDSIDKMPVTIDSVVKAYNDNQASVLASTQRQIEFDQRIGNTADALTQTQALYLQGNASLVQLDQAYNDNQVSVQKATDANNKFYSDTGQFGLLLSSISGQITQGVTDSQAKVTLDVYQGNTAAIDADTKSAIAHREAQDKLTQSTWDATYATANAATQSQMRQSLVSPIVSQQSTIQGLDAAVFNAKLSVIAAQSAVQVQELQAEVTATQDLASIITASAAVAKAQGDKQLARLNDSIPIMNDNNAIMLDLQQGNVQQLQIDKEQLLIDKTTAAMNQAVATFQITIAQDQLKAAQDKMMVDQMNAQAAYQVAVDNLQLAQDNVTLAEAQQSLGIDQLTVLNNIDTTLGSVTDYLNLIDGDLQNLQNAQDNIQTDQSNLAYDTSNQNIIAQQGNYTLAGDTVQSASDNASMQQAQQAYELQIAQYKVQLNAYQLQQKDSQTNGQSTAALQAMVKVLQDMLTNIHSPAGKAVMAAGIGANNLNTLQASFASTQVPMGFS